MVQAVFLDFDNTLFSHGTMSIPQSAKDAIKTLQTKGIKCVLATGRHIRELTNRFSEVFSLDLDGYVTVDGQMVHDKDKSVIYSNSFKGESLEELLAVFNEKKIQTILVENDRLYTNFNDEHRYRDPEAETVKIRPTGEYTGNPIYLGVVYITEEQEPLLKQRMPHCAFLRWGGSGADVAPAGIDKVSGIHEYLEHFGIPHSDWMAMGDSYNDIAMVDAAPIGIAMGNAIEQLKAVADYVTTDIDDNGLMNALVHYGLV